MDFVKAHATANDFVVLDDRHGDLGLSPALVRALCDRRRGVGADGILRLAAPRGSDGAADVFMDYRNADGSVVETCGNGLRVTAKYLVDRDLVTAADGTVRVGTRAGVRTAHVERGGDGLVRSVTVEMGRPGFRAAAIPFGTDGAVVPEVATVDVAGEAVALSPVSIGNPHAVVAVEDVDEAPVGTLGPALERHARFPEGTNVEFVQALGERHVRLRVWERGVGETASCGSGACAAVVALSRRGIVTGEVEVESPGGRVIVRWDREETGAASGAGGTVWLRGPAVEVARGRLTRDWLETVRDETATAAVRR